MAVGQRTVGSQTSAWPVTADVVPTQSEANDPVVEDPALAEARDFNLLAAATHAMQAVVGATPRGLVEVAGTVATVGAFEVFYPTAGAMITFSGATVALTPGTPNSIYLALPSGPLVASTGGFPAVAATPHVPLATWPGSGTTVTDMRSTLIASAYSAPAPHAASHGAGGPDEISVTGLSGLLAEPQIPLSHAAATHLSGGSDELDADLADIDYSPASGYTPDTTGSPGGATTSAHLAAHLKGIADALGAGGGAHASAHEDGGADEIDVTGLSGLLATAQTPAAHKATHEDGGADEIDVTGLTGLLATAQTPAAHAASHKRGGSDQIDGDLLDVDYSPASGYTPDTTGSPGGATHVEELAAHLLGISTAIAGKAASSHAHATSDITSGTLADARVAESNVTQHEAALDIATAQVVSGTFADARIAESNVTQHEAALDIIATQIVSGDLAIARLAAALLLSAKGDILTHSGSAFAKLAAGTNGHILTADSAEANGIKWAAAAAGGLFASVALYQDQKSSGTGGGTFTAGAWRTRDLTTEVSDPDGIGSLAANQVTLGAGSYVAVWIVTSNAVRYNLSRLYDATNVTVLCLGSTGFATDAATTGYTQVSIGRFALAGTAAIEIQHYCSDTASFGVASSLGTEVYANLLLLKEA